MSRESAAGTSRGSTAITSRGSDAGTSRGNTAVMSRGSDVGTSRGNTAVMSRGSDVGTSRGSAAGKSKGSDTGTSRERVAVMSRKSDAGKSRERVAVISRESDAGNSRERVANTSRGSNAGEWRVSDASTSRGSNADTSRRSDAGTSRGSDAGTSRERVAVMSRKSDAGKWRVSDANTSRGSNADTSRRSDAGTSRENGTVMSKGRAAVTPRGSDADTLEESDTGTSRGSAAIKLRESDTSSLYVVDEEVGIEFLAFKEHLTVVRTLIDSYKVKIINKTLCEDDLDVMQLNLKNLSKLEQQINEDKMKSAYVPYKIIALKMLQESYYICNWLIQKQFSEMDNVFEINSFFDNIFKACAGTENPLDHINTLFTGILKNTNNFNLHIFGNIKQNNTGEIVLKPARKEYQKSQKRPLEDQVIPFDVENELGDNELQITMTRVKNCLTRAVSNNNGKPISFIKFAIDPFSLPHTIENLFHLALLVKDKIVKIGLNTGLENDKFATITVVKRRHNENNTNQKDDFVSSLFKINRHIWKKFIAQYNIEEQMIPHDD